MLETSTKIQNLAELAQEINWEIYKIKTSSVPERDCEIMKIKLAGVYEIRYEQRSDEPTRGHNQLIEANIFRMENPEFYIEVKVHHATVLPTKPVLKFGVGEYDRAGMKSYVTLDSEFYVGCNSPDTHILHIISKTGVLETRLTLKKDT